MDPLYRPHGVETKWQEAWEAEGLYNAEASDPRPSFAIAHPPPNVTGDLHLGHALQLSLADTIVRTRRMQGYNVLFQPGYDHAGISTQNVIEKQLAAEEKTRQDLGREAFVERTWAWLEQTGRTIFEQLRKGPRAVGEIADELPVSRPAVSQHLRVLKEAGLVTERRNGTRRIYRVDPDGLGELRAYFDEFWNEALAAFKAAAEDERRNG